MTTYHDRIDAFEQLKNAVPAHYAACKAMAVQTRTLGVFSNTRDAMVRLGICVGLVHAGSIQSAVRHCLREGCTKDDVLHVVSVAAGTLGMPQLTDVHAWIVEALAEEKA